MAASDGFGPAPDPAGSIRVLVVCTANICRSPVVAGLLQKYLAENGHNAWITSAGTVGSDRPPHQFTIDAARLAGLDIRDHVARRVTADMLRTEGADLVIGLTREHLRHSVGLSEEAWTRTFTLKELARRATALATPEVTTPAVVPGLTQPLDRWADWVRALSLGRSPADFMRPDPADDVPDPYGRPATDHMLMVHMVDQISRHIARLAPR